MKRLALVLLTVFAYGALANAQSIAGTIEGVFDVGLSSSLNTVIPNYGEHGFVKLTTGAFTPEEVRDLALPIFTALAGTRSGNVSVSVHFSTASYGGENHVVLFQKFDGEIRVYLDGEPF